MNDIVLHKVEIVERCVKRVREVYENNPNNLSDFTKQDSMILNIQRACEASIDIAMHVVSKRKLGVPKTSRDAFQLLLEHRILDADLATTLMNMDRFRNIAVHNYQALNLDILKSIIDTHLDDFLTFTKVMIQTETEDNR